MSQHDFEIANQGFPSFRSDLNSGLQALASNSAGATEPSTTYAYQFWYDSTANLLKMRNTDDDAWITLAYFDQTNDEWEVRSAVIQAVDSAGVQIKTDDGTARITVNDNGTVDFANNIDVTGTVTADGADLDGAVVINESGADVDFRVESDTSQNALFVEGSSGNVGIGAGSPGSLLTLSRSGDTATLDINGEDGAEIVLHRTAGGAAGSQYKIVSSVDSLSFTDVDSGNVEKLVFFTGGTVFNNGGIPTEDFRVESDNNSHMIFVNSGQDRVGIGTSVPSTTLDVNGSLSKNSGSFKIDHPLKPETHHLIHSFVEAPQADNIYRGKVDLVNGTATVNIDTVAGMTEGTFVALNRDVQCFTSNESGWTAVRGSVSGNILTIEAQDNACTDTISWLVIGERQDQHMYDTEWTDEKGKVIVEPEK